ncbi:MAG: ribulose-phosphate 3-epimerase [Gammaproteobacteria bacterium]|nr:ribulose-phosphate 3-epimerase [Gammaproteobacteria bacterium]MCH9744473.1 ribulose-phosphate 3-epimerase [Gammaproteobacteria bacterium]
MSLSNNPAESSIISASILSADFAHLADDVQRAIDAGIQHIHFDVMDHHFVPNLTFGACVCSALRKAGITTPIDVHLMVEQPEQYIEAFAKAGANWITFHPGTTQNVMQTVDAIIAAGMQAGLAFNPDEAVVIDDDVLEKLKTVLLMSVFPGFAGQSFIDSSIDKIRDMQKQYQLKQRGIYLGVDGGIKANNIKFVADAGADFFVVGSGLFHTDDYTATMSSIINYLSSNL